MEHHEDPHEWLGRLTRYATEKSQGHQIWIFFPQGILVPLWTNERNLERMVRDKLWHQGLEDDDNKMCHPMDLEYQVLEKFARKVYMPYSSANPTLFHNTVGIRILIDLLIYEVPRMFDKAKDPFKNLPRGPILFIQTLKDKLFSYDARQFKRDWPLFFRNNTPSFHISRKIKEWIDPINVIEQIREYKNVDLKNFYIKYYLREPITNVCSQEDRCETMLFGATLIRLTGDPWFRANQFPSKVYQPIVLDEISLPSSANQNTIEFS